MKNDQPKFPIGKLQLPATITAIHLIEAITVLKEFPEKLKIVTASLTAKQLDTPYREDAWTIRQLVHHIADSHNHSYNRFRWTLTENKPTIKAYGQDAYAAMQDYITDPISWSLTHIEVVHYKLVSILNSLTEAQWERSFIHPETKEEINLKELALTYAWHSMHHLAHIKNAV